MELPVREKEHWQKIYQKRWLLITLNTGLLYRICALEILEKKINIEKIDIELWLKRNKDLSVLRTDKVSIETSRISKKKNVRKFLLKFQKILALST